MEGPYRDLGAGFARLAGQEGLRRSPARLRYVEDALYELLRNARDAGARNIYVASSLRARRYRHLAVIDDGRGIPETHKHLVFEPGVTTRHLDPVPIREPEGDPNCRREAPIHGAGLSLYHIKNAALSAEILSASRPTAIKAVFDTRVFPEKSLQTPPRNGGPRTSKTNLSATLVRFARQTAGEATPPGRNVHEPPRLYHASPARVLARLLNHRIIQPVIDRGEAGRIRVEARRLGLDLSLRTVQRAMAGEVPAAPEVGRGAVGGPGPVVLAGGRNKRGPSGSGGPILSVGGDDLARIEAVLRRAARRSYLDLAGLEVEERPGEVILRADVFEPEDEYDE